MPDGGSAVTVVSLERQAQRRRRWTRWLHGLFAALGLVALVWVVQHVGVTTVMRTLRATTRWMPLVLALEALRIGAEAVASRWALGSRGPLVPWSAMLRAHFATYPVCTLAPAGRPAAEAAKAALLSRYVGAPAATAFAVTNQALTLIATGVFTLPCLWAAWRATGSSSLTIALTFHFVGLTVLGVTMRFAMRAGSIRSLVMKRIRRLAAGAASFHDAANGVPAMPAGPLAALVAGRAIQVLQLGLLAHAVGADASLPGALVSQGVNLVAMAVGALVPAQIGATEGAFALSAGALGATVADAVVIALATHLVQLVFVVFGSLTPLFWPSGRRVSDATAVPRVADVVDAPSAPPGLAPETRGARLS